MFAIAAVSVTSKISAVGIDAVLGDHRARSLRKLVVAERASRDRLSSRLTSLPEARSRAISSIALRHHPAVELDHQPGALGRAQERTRQDQLGSPSPSSAPTPRTARPRPEREIHDRLQERLMPSLSSALRTRSGHERRASISASRSGARRVDGQPVAPRLLGLIHRDVGVGQQRLGVQLLARLEQRHADAGRDPARRAADEDGVLAERRRAGRQPPRLELLLVGRPAAARRTRPRRAVPGRRSSEAALASTETRGPDRVVAGAVAQLSLISLKLSRSRIRTAPLGRSDSPARPAGRAPR